ncbi:MAG: hypothetical protein ACRYE9_03500, partial [Janthinobacterium lividum]
MQNNQKAYSYLWPCRTSIRSNKSNIVATISSPELVYLYRYRSFKVNQIKLNPDLNFFSQRREKQMDDI